MSEGRYNIDLLAVASWLDVKPATGDSGTVVTVEAKEYNESELDRSTTVRFAVGGVSANLSVTQQAGLLPNTLKDSDGFYLKDSDGYYLVSNG